MKLPACFEDVDGLTRSRRFLHQRLSIICYGTNTTKFENNMSGLSFTHANLSLSTFVRKLFSLLFLLANIPSMSQAAALGDFD